MVSPTSTTARHKSHRGEGLGRRQRLLSPRLFDEAYEQNRKFVGRHLVMFLRTGEEAALRLGVVTGRKVGNAVQRARGRRLLREAFRRQRAGFRDSFDVVLVARSGISEVGLPAVMADLAAQATRARLVSP